MNPVTDDLLRGFGGLKGLQNLMREFYRRLYDDRFVGFLFHPFNQQQLIDGQIEYVRRIYGDFSGDFALKNLRDTHQKLKINGGQFDRRNKILRDVLKDFAIDPQYASRWLKADERLRSSIVHQPETKCHPPT